jgi:outer membrane protein assembly factor BamB
MPRLAFLFAATLLLAPLSVHAEDWPCWRGAKGDGLSNELNVPTHWSATENVLWKIPISGRGHSSPVVWQDSIFVTSADDATQQRLLYHIDRRSGAVIWVRTVLVAPVEKMHLNNSPATGTPATDGRRVFVGFQDRDQMFVAAYDFAGNRLWEQRPGPFSSSHGFAATPVLYRDVVIMNGDHDGDAYLTALRQDTGEIVWKTERQHKTRSFSTPIIMQVDGRDQLLICGNHVTAGYDPVDGKQIWTCDGPTMKVVCSPVHHGDLVFSMGGSPDKHLLAIRKGGAGDVSATHIAWRTTDAVPYVPSPLVYGDLLHCIADNGVLTCFDPPSGKVHFRKRVGGSIWSSLVGACGRIYITDAAGITTVIENQPTYTVLAKNELGEDVFASPAISQGSLFIRGVQHLYRIGEPTADVRP